MPGGEQGILLEAGKSAAAGVRVPDFTDKEKELKKALADATTAVEREKRNVSLSVGPMDDVEALEGDLLNRATPNLHTACRRLRPDRVERARGAVPGNGNSHPEMASATPLRPRRHDV